MVQGRSDKFGISSGATSFFAQRVGPLSTVCFNSETIFFGATTTLCGMAMSISHLKILPYFARPFFVRSHKMAQV
jgi:hypothetical protein